MKLTTQEKERLTRLMEIYNALDEIKKVNLLMFGEGMVAALQSPGKGA